MRRHVGALASTPLFSTEKVPFAQYRNHTRADKAPASVDFDFNASSIGVKQPSQDSLYVFSEEQSFPSSFADVPQAASQSSLSQSNAESAITLSQSYPSNIGRVQRPPTPPYTTDGSSGSISTGSHNQSCVESPNFEAFTQYTGSQQSQAPQAQSQLFSFSNQASVTSHSQGSILPSESISGRANHQPPLQIQIPNPPSIPRINMPDAPYIAVNPAFAAHRSYPTSPNEAGRLSVTPNISRPASSQRGPSPAPSSASASAASGRIPYSGPSSAFSQNDVSLLQPFPRAPAGADPAQLAQIISQQTQAYQQMQLNSPNPGVQASQMSAGFQHSPNGSPYPPLTPITPSYSPYVSSSNPQLPQTSPYSFPEFQSSTQSLFVPNTNGLDSLAVPHPHSAGPHSPISEPFPSPRYAASDSGYITGKIGLGIDFIPTQQLPPALKPAERAAAAVPLPPSPHLPPNPSQAPAESHTLALTPPEPGTLNPSVSVSSASISTSKEEEKKLTATGRPRGRPKGSKNKIKTPEEKAKLAPILGARTNTKTGRPRGRPRKQPLPSMPLAPERKDEENIENRGGNRGSNDVVEIPNPVPQARDLKTSSFTFSVKDLDNGCEVFDGDAEAKLRSYAVRASKIHMHTGAGMGQEAKNINTGDESWRDGDAEFDEDERFNFDDEDAEGEADEGYNYTPLSGLHLPYGQDDNGLNFNAGPRKRARQGSIKA